MAKLPDLNYKPIGQWPGTLTVNREHSRFDTPWGKTLSLLTREIEHLGGEHIVFQIAVPEGCIRLDGGIKAGSRDPEHPGVIISFDSNHGPLAYFTDLYREFQDNVRAIALALEALRTVDRYGVNKGAQYTGYKRLPPAGATTTGRKGITTVEEAAAFIEKHYPGVTARQILEFPPIFETGYRQAARKLHPQAGPGNEEAWIDLQEAAALLRKKHGLDVSQQPRED